MSYGTIQIEKMTTESGYSLGAGNASSFKNRLINGGMVIAQRTSGASANSSAGGTFAVDRFASFSSGGGIFSTQRSTDVPTGQGFVNSIVSTVTTTDSPTGTDYYIIQQGIEGFNTADLGWGTANAKPITVSFWVKSSIAGTYTVAFRNGGFTRAYRANYTINSANTWEQKVISISGDTTGTWATNSDVGVRLGFTLGAGSNYTDTPNVWSASEAFAATGQTQWIETSGATFFLTGVQFEVGTVASSFDFRPFGTEMSLCMRYTYVWNNASATDGYQRVTIASMGESTTSITSVVQLPVRMRAQPSFTPTGSYQAYNGSFFTPVGLPAFASSSAGNFADNICFTMAFSSGIVAGSAYHVLSANNNSCQIIYSAEI